MPYRLEPQVAGQLGESTELDPSRHPPTVTAVEYVLDSPDADDLIESFPVFLVSERLAARIGAAGLGGFRLEEARVRPSDEYLAGYGDVAHGQYRWLRIAKPQPGADAWLDDAHRLCVSDRLMEVLRSHRLDRCGVEAI